jgi:uncharacterized protein YlxW (UPF0749 family)
MNANKEENLTELFAKFVDSEQADELAAEVTAADKIIDSFAAPEPDAEILSVININVKRQLNANRSRQMIYRLAAAAVFLIIATMAVKLFQQTPAETPGLVMATWEIVEVTSADAELSTLIAEVEQLEADIIGLQYAEETTSQSSELNDLEMELIEIDSDFWKGSENEDETNDNPVDSISNIGNHGTVVSCGRKRHFGYLAG